MRNNLSIEVEGFMKFGNENEIMRHQKRYTLELVKKYGLENCRTTKCPIIEEFKKYDKITYTCDYNGIIRSLQYLANGTRPDITTAVDKVSQYSTSYGEQHRIATLR
eukprot:Awhi_evm1s8465